MITVALFLCAGGAGAVGRSLLTSHLNPVDGLPWGTLLVNASGSFLLGLASSTLPPVVTVIGVGGIGAYTTFSTFSVEVVRLVANGHRALAGGYAAASVLVCTGAAWTGMTLVI